MDLSPRIAEDRLSAILAIIAAPPHRRETPLTGDVEGDFDFWFDGGASKNHTGTQHYLFSDGTQAMVVFPAPWLQIVVEFKDGRTVEINQLRKRPAERVTAKLFDRPVEWHCIFCGWQCTETFNAYLCKQCGRLRPFAGESATMVKCLHCQRFSLAIAAFCEWCGHATGEPNGS